MKNYADTSFIVSLYLDEEFSPKAFAFMKDYGQALPFTPWHRLEVRNAIRLTNFRGVIDSSEARTQLQQLDADVREQTLVIHQPIDWTDVLHEAEKLGATHNQSIGCRAADLFHVAAAKRLGCEQFLTWDQKQKAMAKAAGLRVGP